MLFPYVITYWCTWTDPVAAFILEPDKLVLYLVALLQTGQFDTFFDGIRLNIDVIRTFSQYQNIVVFQHMLIAANNDVNFLKMLLPFGFPFSANQEISGFLFINFASSVYNAWFWQWCVNRFLVIPFGHHVVVWSFVIFNDCLSRYLENRDLHMPPKTESSNSYSNSNDSQSDFFGSFNDSNIFDSFNNNSSVLNNDPSTSAKQETSANFESVGENVIDDNNSHSESESDYDDDDDQGDVDYYYNPNDFRDD